MHIVIFIIDGRLFAVNLSVVERIIRVVEMTNFPNAPESVMGVINVQGNVIPVINLRKILGISDREFDLNDQLIICKTGEKFLALWVDSVKKLAFYDTQDLIAGKDVFPNMDAVEYVIKDGEQITLVYELDKLLQSANVTVS